MPAIAPATRVDSAGTGTERRRWPSAAARAWLLAALAMVAHARDAAAQAYGSMPAPDSPIYLTGTMASPGVLTLEVLNLAAAGTLDVAPSALGAPLSLTPPTPQSIPASGQTSYQITCAPSQTGQWFEKLTFATNDPQRPTVTYPITCATPGSFGAVCPIRQVSPASVSGPPNAVVTLVAQQIVTTSPPRPGDAPLGAETFNWVASPGFTFLANGSNSLTVIESLSFDPAAGVFKATSTVDVLLAGTPGASGTISANSASCGGATPPVVYDATVEQQGTIGSIRPLVGDGEVANVGALVTIRGRIEYQGKGTTPSVQLNIAIGDARFEANGQRTLSVPTNAQLEFEAQVRFGGNPGPIAIDATAEGFDPYRFNLQSTFVQTLTILSGNNQVGVPGRPGQNLVVEVRENGQPAAGVQVDWRVVFGNVVTLGATTSQTDVAGRASVGITFNTAPGEGEVEARTARGESVRFRVRNQAAGLAVVEGDNQTGAAGSVADLPITFRLQNGEGQPIAGERVDFALVQGTASFDVNPALTDPTGVASVRLRYGPSAGEVRIQASAFGGQNVAFARASVFQPTLALGGGDGQSGPAGSALPQPLVVVLGQPALAKGLAGIVVNWSVLSGGGTLSSTTTQTGSDGRASVGYTLGPQGGLNQVRASVAGVGEIVFSATAAGGSGPPPGGSVLEIVSGDNQVLPTTQDSEPLVVRLRTSQGQPIANACIQWTGSANVQLSASQTSTGSNGQSSITAQVGVPGPATVTARTCDGSLQAVFDLNGGVQNIEELSPAQESVATAIDVACPALAAQTGSLDPAQQDLLARCSELVVNAGDDPGDVTDALEALLGDESQAQGSAAIATTSAQFQNLKARIEALRGGATGISVGGLTFAGSDGVLPLSFLPSAVLAEEQAGGGEAGAGFSRWGFFASGTIGNGERDRTTDNPGFEFDTWGVTAGVDYRASDSLVLGMALGFNSNDTDVGADQGRLETRGWNVSGYGSFYQGDTFYADGVLTWGRNRYDITRRIRYMIDGVGGGVTTVDQTASAEPDGDQLQFALSLGRDFVRGPWSIGPYLRGTYTRIDFDGYVERLSNPGAPGSGLALAVDGRELKSLEGVLGGKVSYTTSTSWGVLIPHLQVEWLHEFEDSPEDVVSRFVSDPSGTPITIAGETLDSNYFNLGLGLSGVFANGRSAFVYYEHRAGQTDYSQDSLAIGIRIEF
jgi:outer membrane autotransporter protein